MEIELKARVRDFAPIKARLKKLGAKYICEKHQIDTYYSPYKQPLVKRKGKVMRVRYDALTKRARLELHIPQNDMAAIEHEVEVHDYQILLKVLKELKAKKEFVIDKRRLVYTKGRFEIVLDTVKKLGKFIEVELDGANTAANRKLVMDFMLGLGVPKEDFILQIHYHGMILKKMGRSFAYF